MNKQSNGDTEKMNTVYVEEERFIFCFVLHNRR